MQEVGQLAVKIADDEDVPEIGQVDVVEVRDGFEDSTCLMEDFTDVFLVQNLATKRARQSMARASRVRDDNHHQMSENAQIFLTFAHARGNERERRDYHRCTRD